MKRTSVAYAAIAVAAGWAAAMSLCVVTADADPGDKPVDVDAQCRSQYPGRDTFLDATAYVVAPGNAYSWRCRQFSSLSGGGVVSNLAVDPSAYCVDRGLGTPVLIDASSPAGWICRP